MVKNKKVTVQGSQIGILLRDGDDDFISLTDMARKFGDDVLIYQWMRNRNTVEFLGIWEQIHNPVFKGLEFETFKKQAGMNSFSLTPKKWVAATKAIGLISKAGRYGGGTYAVKKHLVPPQISKQAMNVIYASEADVLNVALFGMTAKEWRDKNAGEEGNIRDHSTVEQLVILSNLESMNAELIRLGLSQGKRLKQLNEIAITQMKSLINSASIKLLN